MAEHFDKGKLMRLEDYIVLAREGKDVHVTIELKKKQVKQKIHPEDTIEMKNEIDMYLLSGNYTLSMSGEDKTITKIYIFGSMEEPLEMANINKNIANERLKMDYQRLRDAKVTFEEKYF